MFQRRKLVLVIGDAVALILSFALMIALRFNLHTQGGIILLQAKIFAFTFAIWLIVFFIFELYNFRRINPNPINVGLLLLAVATNVILSGFIFYLVRDGVSPKTNLAIVGGFAIVLLLIWRRSFYRIFSDHFPLAIAFVGTNPLFEVLTDELLHHPHIGTIKMHTETLEDIYDTAVQLVIVEKLPPVEMVATTRSLNTTVITLQGAYELILGKIPVTLMTDEQATILITREKSALHFIYRFFEIIIASIVLIVSSPFLLLGIIARLIEDGRPIFIKQKRVGKDGKVFTIYKLRSMKALSSDGSAETTGVQWADKKDDRITPIGKIIRKTHIDEIPQMINIIKGDLALVGPRPERPEFVADLEQQIPFYFLRHTIRPGFTGWAQIKFRYARNLLDSREKFEYDLYYLKNKNLLLDIGIVLKTLQIIFTH